jgi:ABC-type phosphate transport system permease subunit
MSVLLVTVSIWLAVNVGLAAALYFNSFPARKRTQHVVRLEPETPLLPGALTFARRPPF